MKIIFLTLNFLLITIGAYSQQCANDSLIVMNPGDIAYTQPGFIDPNVLPCIKSGSYSELVIPFKTYNQGARLLTLADSSTIPISHVYGIQVESISNLPSGLCWIVKGGSTSISGDQVGALIIKGTPTLASGTYQLSVGLSLDIQGSGSYTYTGLLPWNYQNLLGQVVLKVVGSDNNCPAVNQ